MKRKLLLSLGLVIGLGAFSTLLWTGVTHAANVRTGSATSVAKNEVIDGSLYIAGNDVTVDGTVKGDVFCAGMNITISGTVEGDVICGGRTVRVTGTVQGDVRLGGQEVDLGAIVGGSATLAGQTVVFQPEASVGRDVTVAGESVHLDGRVGRDVLGGVQDLVLAGTVSRNVDVQDDTLSLINKASVGGSLTYKSSNEVAMADGASVVGQTIHHDAPAQSHPSSVAVRVWGTLYGLGAMLLIGLAVLAVAPRWMDAVAGAVAKRSIASFAAGAVVLVMTPILAGLLTFTIIGLPLAIVMILLLVAALISALAMSAYALGWMLVVKMNWPARGRRVASLFLGLLVLALVGLIPIVGGIVTFVAMLFGLGGLATAGWQHLNPHVIAKGKKA